MKKVVAVMGSPRRESRSSQVAEAVIAGIQEGSSIVIEYDINNIDFSGCKACGLCKKEGTDCVIEDDFQDYLEDIKNADILLLSTPNYFSNIAGPMISFLNRHYCLIDKDSKPRLPSGKKVFGVFSQGAPESFTQYETVYETYMKAFEILGFENAGHVTIGGDSDIESLVSKAEEIGKNL